MLRRLLAKPLVSSGAAAFSLLSLAFVGALPAPVRAQAITDAQRPAIEQIVRDYLLKNPEVIQEAIGELEKRQQEAQRNSQQTALREHGDALTKSQHGSVVGNASGDVTLVEFFDYRCPYCKQVAPAIDALLAEDKKLRVVYKEFPVLGADSITAARAALAAQKQGKYEALHRALIGMKGQINEAAIFGAAKSAGLDVERLKRDMETPEIDGFLQANHQLASALDIRGTPGFVIGDEVVPGAVSVDALRQMIATARSEKEK